MNVTVNGVKLDLKENDTVQVTDHECRDCGSHTEFEVMRDNKVVANFGSALYLFNRVEKFGDVAKGRDPKSLQVIPL